VAVERVQKIIAASGLCSKRKAEELISAGVVKVNGQQIKLGDKADAAKDEITVNGKPVRAEQKIYLAMNKPRFVVTSAEDRGGKKTIYEFLESKERLFYAGRLDFDAEGLIILTNDGDFANRVAHPRYETEKKYVAHLNKPITAEDADRLKKGVTLEDGPAKADKMKRLSENIVEISLHEGRKHIVKRMFENIGYKVKRLIRVSVGPISLGDLKPGKTRPLSRAELEYFKKI